MITPKKTPYALLAFLIPFFVRCIPEILMGPYLVGFDTIAHYLPTTIFWSQGYLTLESFIGTAPMLYIITTGLVQLGTPIVLVLKILPPMLLGFLGLAIYGFARTSLQWATKKSLVPALLGTLYFVALRVSWDALREEIALIFLFTALTFLISKQKQKFPWIRYAGFSLATTAVVLSNQVVAVLMLGILTLSLLHQLIKKNLKGAAYLAGFTVPAALLFLATFLATPAVPEYRIIFGFPQTNDGWLALFGYSSYPAMLATEAGFLLFCFLPLLPLALLSVRRLRNIQIQIWIILILIVAFIPIASPSNMRLLTLLVYPMAFYVAEGLSKLKTLKNKPFRIPPRRTGLVYLIIMVSVLSLGFMVLPPQTPFPYFSNYLGYHYQIPSSMLQNTVSITDCQNVENSVQWLKENAPPNSIVLTHRAFYGWALTKLEPNQVLLYEYDNPADAANTTTADEYDKIFTVWWVNGEGWYGQPTIDPAFKPVYVSGNIAVYTYQPI
jgi:hypothetical protein